MINNLVSINVVLQEIIRDLGLGQTSIPSSDMKEWIIEALKHIGVAAQFRKEVRKVVIKDYTGQLPCETYKVVKLMEAWKFRYNEYLHRDDDTTKHSLEDQNHLLAHTCNDYSIEFQEVTTSFQEGEMHFMLLLFPLDEEGFLQIPDDISYKDALMWKIAYQLAIRGHKFPNVQMRNIDFCSQKWHFYCKQARGNARMGDARLLELFARSANKMIPDFDNYDDDYKNLNDKEQIKLDVRSGNLDYYGHRDI